MLNLLQRGISLYTARPLGHARLALMHLLLQMLFAFAVLGVYTVAFFIAAFLNVAAFSIPMLIVTALLATVLAYVLCGLKGAYISACADLANNQATGFFEMYKSTFVKAPKMFTLFVIHAIAIAVFVGPVAAAYYFALAKTSIPYIAPITAIIGGGIAYIISYLFFAGYVSAAVYNTGVKSSIAASFKCIRTTHVFLLVLFGIYVLACITALVPLVQIISIFVTIPVVYLTLIAYFQGKR